MQYPASEIAAVEAYCLNPAAATIWQKLFDLSQMQFLIAAYRSFVRTRVASLRERVFIHSARIGPGKPKMNLGQVGVKKFLGSLNRSTRLARSART